MLDIIKRNNAIEIPVSGKLDMESARKFEKEFSELITSLRENVVGINMGNLKFLDSSGLSILMKITSAAGSTGKNIFFIALSPTILSVMKVAKLDNVLHFMTEEDFNKKYPVI